MSSDPEFDFWYAVNNTRIVRAPTGRLETFGNTMVHYHLVTELMDDTGRIRVREGKVEAYRPTILTPDHLSENLLEGFGDDAHEYLDWLRQHEHQLMIIQQGFAIKKQHLNEHSVSGTLEQVTDQVVQDLDEGDHPLSAVVVGVEEPWEVCLVKLLVDLAGRAAPVHAKKLQVDPHGDRQRIEQAFRSAEANPAQLGALSQLLRDAQLFEEYEDRFFSLVRSRQ